MNRRQTLSIPIVGCYGAGKSTFINTISDIAHLATEATKLDYGKVDVDDELVLQFYGAPKHSQHADTWELIAEGMVGFILVVDSSQPATFPLARTMLNTFAAYAPVPYIIAANKQDMPDALDPAEIWQQVHIRSQDKSMACVATDRPTVIAIARQLLELIIEDAT